MANIQDTSERLLQSAADVSSSAEVFSVESESRSVQFEANRAKNVTTRQSAGSALRIVSGNGRVGFASTTDDTRLPELAQRAAAVSEYGAEAQFDFPSQSALPEVASADDQVAHITEDDILAVGEGIVERVLAEFPDALCDVHVTTVMRHRQRLINSAGADIVGFGTHHSISAGAEIISGTDMLSVWDGTSSAAVLSPDDVDALVERLLTNLRNAQRIVNAPTGKDIPVFFTPQGVAGTLLPPLLSGFNGQNVATGASPLIDRWGDKVLEDSLTIYDDPLRPMTSGSRRSDDEGVAARRIPLVTDGVIGEPLLDLQTAAKCGMTPNGCGLRGLSTTPSPNTSFVCVEPGNSSDADMIGGIDRGIVVQQLLGAGQGNQLGGDFRANLSLGFLVESGEVAGRVKDTMISGNVYEVLSDIEGISSETQTVWGSSELPAVLCRGVEVAAA